MGRDEVRRGRRHCGCVTDPRSPAASSRDRQFSTSGAEKHLTVEYRPRMIVLGDYLTYLTPLTPSLTKLPTLKSDTLT
jgi:hypothetical protein